MEADSDPVGSPFHTRREGRVDSELRQVIAALLRNPVLTAEGDPDAFRLAIHHRAELGRWFDHTTGWRFEAHPTQGLCRLYKRRFDPPTDRAPLLIRQQRAARRSASQLVLTLLSLVCEQLWRHPETSFNDLQRAIEQTSATEADSGRLPRFQPAPPGGQEHARANAHRTALVDAIRLLADWHIVTVDRPLDVAERDEQADLFITARAHRLAVLLACPSPMLLDVDLDQPDTHIRWLCADQAELPEHASSGQRDVRRRHLALRSVLDDPGIDPDPNGETPSYLASPTGRRHALDAAAAAGLVCTVRRDWWLIADPTGTTTDLDFPNGRSQEQQAALLLLAELTRRDNPTGPISLTDATTLLQAHLDRRAWWAARYRGPNGARRLALRAAQQLVAVGVLCTADLDTAVWIPTPAIHLWRVRVSDATVPADNLPPSTEEHDEDEEAYG